MNNDLNKLLSSSEFVKMEKFWNEEAIKNIYVPEIDNREISSELVTVELSLNEDFFERISEVAEGDRNLKRLLVLSFWMIYIFKSSGNEGVTIQVDLTDRKVENQDVQNSLPLILGVEGGMTIGEICQSVLAKYNQVITHELFPLEKIKFPHSFYQFGCAFNQSEFPLVTLHFENNKLELLSNYYSPEQLKVVGRRVTQFFQNSVTRFNDTVESVSYLGEKEVKQLIKLSEGVQIDLTDADIPINGFTKVVREKLDETALVGPLKKLTYSMLDQLSDQLAIEIKEKYNLSVGHRVAVLLDGSENLVITFLAIQKLRLVYVPIDKEYPEDRIRFIVSDSNARLVVLERKAEYNISDNNEKGTEILDLAKWEGKSTNQSNAFEPPLMDDQSFIIYSSGTTGRPKGAVHSNKCLANLIKWQIEDSGIPSGINNLQYTSLGFDVSLQEIMFSLLSGGVLHMIPTRIKRNFILLEDYIIENNINSCYFTCSVLNAFFNASTKLDQAQLNHIITGGEKLSLQKGIKSYLENKEEAFVYNFYGPSETHGVTWYPINKKIKNLDILPPIGFPIYNTSVFVLDNALNVSGFEQEGELYITGEQVAIGYNNRSELTDQRFISIPQNTQRTFRTGDYAKWNAGQDLLFTTRKDLQVKINGNRVELSEIDKHILDIDGMKEVTTQFFKNEQELGSLVTFYIGDIKLEQDKLKSALQEFLPDYMIPSRCIELTKIPFTSNRKLDVQKLYEFYKNVCDREQEEIRLPQTEMEKNVFEIWCEVLSGKAFGIDSNFFEVGGDSLKIIQLSGILQKEFDIEFPVTALFEFNTIEKIVGEFLKPQKNKKIKVSNF